MTTISELWTPPAGMAPEVAAGWRKFYANALRDYGITPAQYRALYLAQLGRCYICQTARGKNPDDPKGTGTRRLGVDHNHVIGNRIEAVRGLLCSGSFSSDTCNRMIGRYDLRSLHRAVDYVTFSPAQRIFAAMGDGLSDEAIQGMAYEDER
jgi:hypothetical protein